MLVNFSNKVDTTMNNKSSKMNYKNFLNLIRSLFEILQSNSKFNKYNLWSDKFDSEAVTKNIRGHCTQKQLIQFYLFEKCENIYITVENDKLSIIVWEHEFLSDGKKYFRNEFNKSNVMIKAFQELINAVPIWRNDFESILSVVYLKIKEKISGNEDFINLFTANTSYSWEINTTLRKNK